MGNITGASLAPIYERINGTANYHPYDVETFSDWSLEAGDLVKVVRGDENYKSPIHSSSLVWTGSPNMTLTSTGNQAREAVAKVSKKKYARSGYGRRNNKQNNGMWHTIEETDEYYRIIYADEFNGLHSSIEQTASYWRSTLEDTKNSLRSQIEQTASYWRSTLEDTANSLHTEIVQTASGWRTALSGVMSNGRVTAASIATAINEQGQAGVRLSGDWIEIDGNTTINDVFTVGNRTVQVKLPMRVEGNIMAESITLRTHGGNGATIDEDDITNMIVSASVSGNVLTLIPLTGSAITFSKATTLAGTWSGGTLTVSASPQNTSMTFGLFDTTTADVSWSNKKATIKVFANKDGGETKYDTGKRLNLKLTTTGEWSGRTFKGQVKHSSTLIDTIVGIVYDGLVPTGSVTKSGKDVKQNFIVYSDDGEGNADKTIMTKTVTINATDVYTDGYNDGKPISGVAGDRTSGVVALVHDFTITKGDNTTATLQIDCTSIYSAARTGYTLGTFTLASVTLQGGSDPVYISASSGGDTYYKRTTAKYRNAGSIRVYDRGSSKTYYLRNTTALRLKHDGSARHYDVSGNLIGNFDWYHVVSSSDTSGTNYYTAASTSSKSLWDGNGGSYTVQGSEVTVNVIDTNNKIEHLTATTRYKAGTTVSDTYYTKS